MGTLTVDDQVLATLTEIAAREGIGLDELAVRVLGDFVQQKKITPSMGRLFMQMSHELRTPLGSIIGYSQLIYQKLDETPQEKILVYADLLCRNSSKLLAVINDLYDFTRIIYGSIKIESQLENLKALAQKFHTRIQYQSNNAVALKFEVEDDVSVWADESRFWQAIHTLITDYPDNIRTTLMEIQVRHDSDWVYIEMYFKKAKYDVDEWRYTENYRLFIANHIIERHNGTLAIEKDEGVNIIITLPIAQG